MPRLGKTFLAICIFVGGGVLGMVLSPFLSPPQPPNLDDPVGWIAIKFYKGLLDPQDGELTAWVGVMARFSNERDPYTVLQNKIEIHNEGRTFRFLWPDDKTYAAGWCDIADVDGDGRKEFLLYAGTGSLRIVSFSKGHFYYRPRADELFSLDYHVGPMDLDNDGAPEFIEDESYASEVEGDTRIHIPLVKKWTRLNGLEDVSAKFPTYYERTVIPEFQRKANLESDALKRETIQRAIAEIRGRIGQARGLSMAK
jgi:hypothetical protein